MMIMRGFVCLGRSRGLFIDEIVMKYSVNLNAALFFWISALVSSFHHSGLPIPFHFQLIQHGSLALPSDFLFKMHILLILIRNVSCFHYAFLCFSNTLYRTSLYLILFFFYHNSFLPCLSFSICAVHYHIP